MERAWIIKRQFGVSISHWWLSEFYKAHGVTYLQPKTVYRKSLETRAELEPRRFKIAGLLAQLITSNTPIVYMDESR